MTGAMNNGTLERFRKPHALRKSPDKQRAAIGPESSEPMSGRGEILGSVDGFDVRHGIFGWAIDRARPKERNTVLLMLDDLELARAQTVYSRVDVEDIENPSAGGVGFHFEPETFYKFFDLPKSSLTKRPSIRLAGGGPALDCALQIPTVAEIIEEAEKMLPQFSLTDQATQFADLPDALNNLEFEAHFYVRQATTLKRKHAGHLEAFSRVEKDTYFVAGWTSEPGPKEFPATVGSSGKWPAGLIVAFFERDDLPDGALAFVGLMRTRWTPERRGAKFTISYRLEDVEGYISPTSSVQSLTRAEINELLKSRGSSSQDKESMLEIQQYLETESGWTPSSGSDAVDVHIDEIVMVPGFGFFLRGWMLSGPKRVVGMQIRCGGSLARVDRQSLVRSPRPDLLEGFPWAEEGVRTAGMAGVFRGNVQETELTSFLFRITFLDGSTFVREFDVKKVRIIRDSRGAELLRRFYPQIQNEHFFSILSSALRAAIAREIRNSVTSKTQSTEAAPSLCLDLGETGSDMTALFDQLLREPSGWHKKVRVLLLSGDQTQRSLLQAWRSKFPSQLGNAEIVRVSGDHGLLHLPQINKSYPMDRFVYLRPGAIPNTAGWTLIKKHLRKKTGKSPSVLAKDSVDSLRPQDHLLGGLMWNYGELIKWIENSEIRFSQDYLAKISSESKSKIENGTAFVIPRIAPSIFLKQFDAESS